MADQAVGYLLQDLTLLIWGHQDLISGARKDIKDLIIEVELLNAYLHAGGKEQEERLKKSGLERKVMEMVNDVEEAIASSSIQMAAANARNVYIRRLLITELGHALSRAIKSLISARIEPIIRSIQDYGFQRIEQRNSEETIQVPSKQMNKKVPKKIVGFEDAAKTLISSLMEETEDVDVIAITGMPGIGKTTLAWKIYQDNRIRDEFPTRIWLDDFRSKDLWLNILRQLIQQDMIGSQELMALFDIPDKECCTNDSCLEILNAFSMDVYKLQCAVRECLERSKIFLVMDGVWDWNANSLNEVRDMLPKMGKVLVTSRYNHITTACHVLRFLTEKESWDLLQLEVFGKLDECPEILKSTGELIAQNCDGSPLAIAVVGSSLVVASSTEVAKDLTEKWWKAVSENVTEYVINYGSQHNVFERVELSYTKLDYLQKCFLYLGVFPEGHEIPVQTLVRLWIAEGLVQYNERLILESAAEQRFEEIAYDCLHDLVNRNLVMTGKTYPNGQIKTCRLHKVIYGFCKYKAAEQDLYQEIKMSGDRPISLIPNCPRLCIYSHLSEFLSSKPNGRLVRSILCLKEEEKVVLHPKHSSTIHKCFKLLRVLECKYAKFTKFPKKLTKLMLLRYISLSCDDLDVIPETISSLCYLETLVVDTQLPSLKLRANIWRMLKLRHLVTKAAIVLAIKGEGKAGENLQTLTRLTPACCTEDVFTRAPNLKTLGIRGHLVTLPSPKSLRKLECLKNLKLINESAADCQLHLDCFPPHLKSLTLSGTYLGWECMSILGKIYGLEILKLKNNAFVGESWTIRDADGFGRLVFLLIATADLVSWETSGDCFPNLKCLVLKKCEKLRKIPLTLAKSLHTLDVEHVPESVAKSAREIDQEIARRQMKKKVDASQIYLGTGTSRRPNRFL